MPPSRGNAGPPAKSGSAGNPGKLVQQEHREEAKEAFVQHTKETSNLDVLSRCKKLNEFLSSDFLKGKGDQKAQIKEILGILNAGPKRPSFLDKPPVTSTASPKVAGSPTVAGAAPSTSNVRPSHVGSKPAKQQQEDVDDLISLLNDTAPPADRNKPPSPASTSTSAPHKPSAAQTQPPAPPPSAPAPPPSAPAPATAVPAGGRVLTIGLGPPPKPGTAVLTIGRGPPPPVIPPDPKQLEEERKRKEQEALRQQEEARKRQEEARRRKEQEELRLQRIRTGAAVCIQKHWRGYQDRRLVAQLLFVRLQAQLRLERAAAIIQAAWRCYAVRRAFIALRAAARVVQVAARFALARMRLQRLRVQAFMRQRAARIIQRAYRFYRTRGHSLGPLKVRAPRPNSPALDATALAAKQLRLRSAADARLAPDTSGGGAPVEEPAQGSDGGANRTVATHLERVRQVSNSERNRRLDIGERTVMTGSVHRDDVEALAIARQGQLMAGSAGGAVGLDGLTLRVTSARRLSNTSLGNSPKASLASSPKASASSVGGMAAPAPPVRSGSAPGGEVAQGSAARVVSARRLSAESTGASSCASPRMPLPHPPGSSGGRPPGSSGGASGRPPGSSGSASGRPPGSSGSASGRPPGSSGSQVGWPPGSSGNPLVPRPLSTKPPRSR